MRYEVVKYSKQAFELFIPTS